MDLLFISLKRGVADAELLVYPPFKDFAQYTYSSIGAAWIYNSQIMIKFSYIYYILAERL